MRRIAILLIRWYQKFIGPLIPPCCRFVPSCSEYTIEAIEKKGLFKGLLLGAHRILRCNPLCKGGYDPVDKPKAIEDEKRGR